MLVLSRKSGQGIHLSVAGLDVELMYQKVDWDHCPDPLFGRDKWSHPTFNFIRNLLQIGQPQSTIVSSISKRYPK